MASDRTVMTTKTETTVTYTQDGEHYLFLREHGVRSDMILKVRTADCGHPSWVAEQITKGVKPDLAAYTERLQTRANWMYLVLESWKPWLRQIGHEGFVIPDGYGVDMLLAALHELRGAVNGKPS